MKVVLPAETPLEKEIAKRVRRGVAMLDSVTPGWFEPINPATLAVSNREFCVFAQAHHNFKDGIIQVAEKAAAEGKAIKTMDPKDYAHKWGWRDVKAESKVVDTFYYGFDVDAKLEKLASGSRRKAWGIIDRAWVLVVKQKKGFKAEPLRTVAAIIRFLKKDETALELRKAAGTWSTDDAKEGLAYLLRGIRGEVA